MAKNKGVIRRKNKGSLLVHSYSKPSPGGPMMQQGGVQGWGAFGLFKVSCDKQIAGEFSVEKTTAVKSWRENFRFSHTAGMAVLALLGSLLIELCWINLALGTLLFIYL